MRIVSRSVRNFGSTPKIAAYFVTALLAFHATLTLTALSSSPAYAKAEASANAKDAAKKAAIGAYAQILARYVNDRGRVDYKTLAAKDLSLLKDVVGWFAKAEVPSGQSDKIGFFIDAYNVSVLNAVIAHGRPRSVLDVQGFFSAERHTVAGRTVTLDQLEKEILKPIASDPRIHFALVCGAVGCPILETKPYADANSDSDSAGAMEARLERAATRYLASPTGAITEPNHLKLSKIFDWYAEDFGGKAKAEAFARARLPANSLEILGPAPTVGFIDYNWTLNQQ